MKKNDVPVRLQWMLEDRKRVTFPLPFSLNIEKICLKF